MSMLRWSALFLVLGAAGCSKVPVTGRRQYNIVPESIMIGLGKSAYSQTLSESKVEKKGDDAEMLAKVGKRIATVANKKDYDWRYKLLDDDDTINAWCLPGGKIAVYTGILPVLKNEAGMGFVVGHEVGHAVARHGAERLSQQLTVLGGMAGLYLYMDQKTGLSDQQKGIIVAAMGAGAEVGVLLPFSRKQESEADVIGMMYMATAGYPPEESIDIWDRMEKATGGSSLPTFLSTHPSDDNRKANLKDWLPQAKKRYARNKLSGNTQATLWEGLSGKKGK